MKFKKLFNFMSLGSIGALALVPTTISNKKEEKKSKISYYNFSFLQNQNLNSNQLEIQNSNNFLKEISISVKDKESLEKTIDAQERIFENLKTNLSDKAFVSKSAISNFIFIKYNNTEVYKKVLDFVQNEDDIDACYVQLPYLENKKNENNGFKNMPDRVLNSNYLSNFSSNRLTKKDREELIKKGLHNDKKVKVGVLEVGDSDWDGNSLIAATDKEFFDMSTFNTKIYNRFQKYWKWGWFVTRMPSHGKHATIVGSIIGGLDGVNPNVEMYGVHYLQWNGIDGELDYLINEKKVDAINMSFGMKFDKNNVSSQSYNAESAYLDQVARRHPEVIFVKSAGNDGDVDSSVLSGLSLANNILVIGSNDLHGNKSDFSTSGSKTGKDVLLIANGEHYYAQKYGWSSGTSFSAPFISGIVSHMLSEYKKYFDLGFNNIIALSALSSSTFSKSTKDHNITENGAGVFDYQKLENAIKSLKYIKLTGLASDREDKENLIYRSIWQNEIILDEVEYNENDVVRGSLAWMGNVKDGQSHIYDFNLLLKDSNDNIVFSSNSSKKNIEFLKYRIKKQGNYKWVLKRNFDAFDDKFDLAFTRTVGRD